ncbi:hypothetical protein OG948_02680 [Embleya sp. NBC_00888]|uniref:hypothetical protein n=1 Tax=Embleya sp. NBC_00888 TaxID=2975960 RepID=UPI003864E0F4|nr:hypothetical protein OG948_02680 [Embleya sp. NBC_00888]
MFAIAVMSAGLRRCAVVEGRHGLEPMALFVGGQGRMLCKSRWEQVFAAAAERARSFAAVAGGPMPARLRIHDLRHTFAVFMLTILTGAVVERENARPRSGGSGAYLARHVALNPLLTVQRLLGHRSPAATMRYLRYVEQTRAIVAWASEEWADADLTWADHAAHAAGRGVA